MGRTVRSKVCRRMLIKQSWNTNPPASPLSDDRSKSQMHCEVVRFLGYAYSVGFEWKLISIHTSARYSYLYRGQAIHMRRSDSPSDLVDIR